MLARIATVGPDGIPHVTPVGWSLNPEDQTIDVGGIDLAKTKKFRGSDQKRRLPASGASYDRGWPGEAAACR
ncbi:MAG: pyridoxamine 5'-phosphate oxidase family protein [Chloroflexota bacterium]